MKLTGYIVLGFNKNIFMKISFSLFLFVVLSLTNVYAVIVMPVNEIVLKATKDKRISTYKTGNFLKVFNSKESEVKGQLIGITIDSIKIRPFKKGALIQSVAINDITAIQKLHKKGRKDWIPAVSVIAALTILGLIYIDSMLAVILLAAPVIFLFTGLPYLVGSFLADLLSKKSTKKGWRFYSE